MDSAIDLIHIDKHRAQAVKRYDAIRYPDINISAKNSINFTPKGYWLPTVQPKHPFYSGQHDVFDTENFLYPRLPIELGHSELDSNINIETNVLRMPIKFPNTDYRLPFVLKPLEKMIKRIAEYESHINKRHNETFTHITADFSEVEPGDWHRFPGFHGDGLSGLRPELKGTIEHSYIVVSKPATEFCIQPFFLEHLNKAKHNMFHELDSQAKEANIYKSIPYHLYLLDPYMVHRTPDIKKKVNRFFIRVTYAYSELTNPHNTETPLFPERNHPKRHDIREFLTKYPGEVPYEMYGLQS